MIKMVIFADNYLRINHSFYVLHCFEAFLSETGTVAFEVCNHSNAMVVENYKAFKKTRIFAILLSKVQQARHN